MPKNTLVRNSTVTLILMCSALFMIVLDFSIVNVALPSIQRELKLSTADLQWPVTAYALVFGGFMLLGGRAADYFGGQRVFLSGLGLFTLASLAGGLAPNAGVLVAARSFQGLGAAFLAPTVFSLITTHYSEGLERNKAFFFGCGFRRSAYDRLRLARCHDRQCAFGLRLGHPDSVFPAPGQSCEEDSRH